MERPRLDLLVRNAVVTTLDADRRILAPGHVGVRGGRIALVAAGSPAADVTAARVIDARGGLVHPGLIDAHAHVAWGLARCFIPDHVPEDQIFSCFDGPMLAGVRDEEEHLGALLACVEMALNGTTCFADTGSAMRALGPTAAAVEQVGVRGMVAFLNGDAMHGVEALARPLDDCLDRLERGLREHPRGDGLVWACAGLVGMDTATDRLVEEAAQLARRAGVPLNLHASFSRDEVAARRTLLGAVEPMERYGELGALGPHSTLVHVNLLSQREAELLGATRPSVVHCPTASLLYGIGGSRHGRFPELLAAGVPVALGSDATQWQNAWDLTRSLYLAATIHSEARESRAVVSAETALEMATLHGAAAVGRQDELGSLEPGKLADLVVHGVDRPEIHPVVDPVGALVYSHQSRTVRTVVVNGRVIVDDGVPTGVDLEQLHARVERAAHGMRERLGLRPGGTWPVCGGALAEASLDVR